MPAAHTFIDETLAHATRLTPVHRRMADFVRENVFRAATMSIDEFAVAAGASAATANRFARALGFDGYPAFRAALLRGFEANLAPVERLRHAQDMPGSALPHHANDDDRAAELVDEVLGHIVENINGTRTHIDPIACAIMVDAMLQARRTYVVGYGASAFLAGLTAHGMNPYCPQIESLALPGGPSHAARLLASAGAQDVLLAIAFPRYAADTITLTRYARKRGLRVLALTDTNSSPLMPLAHTSILIQSARRRAANSDTAVLAVIEALCDLAAQRSHNAVEAATNLTESVLPWLVSANNVDCADSTGSTIRPLQTKE